MVQVIGLTYCIHLNFEVLRKLQFYLGHVYRRFSNFYFVCSSTLSIIIFLLLFYE